MEIVATTPLPAVDRPNTDRWNAACSRQKKTDGNSGNYVIASNQPPERRPLERRMLAPKKQERPKPGSKPFQDPIASAKEGQKFSHQNKVKSLIIKKSKIMGR